MVAQEARREYAKRSQEAMKKATMATLSDHFKIGTTKTGKGIESAPYRYIETILTATAEKENLE